MPYRLLTEFEALFKGRIYRHRASNQGDLVALHLYEDLLALARSSKLVSRIQAQTRVVNRQNKRQGIVARRGDSTFGEIIPAVAPVIQPGFQVSSGPVATVEIGSEVKIFAKAMIKQVDRVIGDLRKQVQEFRHGGGNPICVGIVGINSAPYTIGYEGDRQYRTDGKGHRHPVQEAAEAEKRVVAQAKPHFDEFLILRYRATNEPPALPFSWVNYTQTSNDYGAILTRVSIEYEKRF